MTGSIKKTITFSAILVGLMLPPSLGALNLITNPGFDSNLDGWKIKGNDVTWSSRDSQGLSNSGSGEVSFPDPLGNFQQDLSQCIPIAPGVEITLEGDIRIDPGLIPGDTPYFGFTIWNDEACSGGSLDGIETGIPITDGSWHRYSLSRVTPAGSRAINVYMGATVADSSNSLTANLDDVNLQISGSCGASDTVLCLLGDRFRVGATWRKPNGETGAARVQKLTDETGYLWFFNPDNVEVIVKVKDACASTFNRFWVFASGLTNVEVSLRVTDTLTGMEWTRVTPLSQPFPPILDTDAFDTCP